MIEIGNNTMSSSVTLSTSGSEMDSQLAEELKKKIEESTTIKVVIVSPTQSPSPYPPINYECNADGYDLYLSILQSSILLMMMIISSNLHSILITIEIILTSSSLHVTLSIHYETNMHSLPH